MLLDWENQLSVGNTTIDDQHKKLISLLNDLHAAMQQGKGKEIISKTLHDLVEYTDYHFGAEEELFHGTAYPGVEAHMVEHQNLIQTVSKLQDDYESGKVMISSETLVFLKNWVTNHIMKTDQGYKTFL